jgi:hypothetical protein
MVAPLTSNFIDTDATATVHAAHHNALASATNSNTVFNVKSYGAVGDGSADDTAAIQATLDAAKAATTLKGSVYFPRGIYKVTQSLNATGFGSVGTSFFGDGIGSSQISAVLTEAYPVIDFTGTGRSHLHDLWIHGGATGLQTCATLHARQVTTNAGDGAKIRSIFIDGTFALAGMAFVSADISSIRDSGITGPVGIVVEVTDVLAVGSKFATFASTTGNTIFVADECAINATARAGVLYGTGATLSIRDSYVNLSGAAAAGIEVLSSSGSKWVNADNYRVESNGSTTDTCVLLVKSGAGSAGGKLTGSWSLNNNGAVVKFEDSTSFLHNFHLMGTMGFTGTGTPKFFSGTGNFRNCQIWNLQPVGLITDMGTSCWNNVVYHQSAAVSWTFPSGYVNVQFNETSQTGLAGSPPDIQVFTASGTWTKPSAAKTVDVTVIPPGGAGGSGRRGAVSTVRCGGGGGGTGFVTRRQFSAADLGSTVTITIPAVTTGGAAITADDTNGANGGGYPIALFGTACSAEGGGGGSGGTATAGVGGLGNTGVVNTGTGSGAPASTTGAAGIGANPSLVGPGSGASGGGITSANVAGAGAAASGSYLGSTSGGGAGGVVDSTSPTGGTAATIKGTPGPGAGSGAASITTAAQPGANAVNYGGGGGGGGASLNGNNSGAGGNGGPGAVLVITYF